MNRRWIALLAGAVATVTLAVCFGLAMDRVTTAAPSGPKLRTVSAAALASLGMTVAPATQPPYCGAEQAVASRGWLGSGSAGCPIGQDAARDAATKGAGGQTVESVLARVSLSGMPTLRDRLAWVVVVRWGPFPPFAPALACAPVGTVDVPVGTCTIMRPATLPDRIVVLDAHSAQILAVLTPGITTLPLGSPPSLAPMVPLPPIRRG